MSRPWMPLYIKDYRGDTARLTTLEHGAYLLLIMEYWDKGGLPDDDAELAYIAGLEDEEWTRVRPRIKRFFSDGWKHKRIDDELAKASAAYEKRANAGRKGGIAKAENKHSPSNATPMPEHCSSNRYQPQPESQSHSSSLRSEEKRARAPRASPPPNPMADLLIEFEGDFWPKWKNKVGKPDALKAFLRARKGGVALETIIAGVMAYTADQATSGRPWLNPSTFLNQRRWEDERAPVSQIRECPREQSRNSYIQATTEILSEGITLENVRSDPRRSAAGTDLLAIDLLPHRGS